MFRYFLSPHGRIGRWGHYYSPLISTLFIPFFVVLSLAFYSLKSFIIIMAVFYGLSYYVYVITSIKRYHDIGLSGWTHLYVVCVWLLMLAYGSVGLLIAGLTDPKFMAVWRDSSLALYPKGVELWDILRTKHISFFVSIIGSFVVHVGEAIYLLLAPGQFGDNKYGSDPRSFRGGHYVKGRV
ncbi:MAG: DUF805 domain-containing protein [Pseudomonadota bacterium]